MMKSDNELNEKKKRQDHWKQLKKTEKIMEMHKSFF